MPPSLTAMLDAENPELVELRRVNRVLQRQLVAQKTKTSELVDAVYLAVRDAYAIAGPAPAVKPPKRDRRSKAAESLLLHTTDWQVGKKTETYNSEVAAHRLGTQLCNKVGALTEVQRSDHPVRRCDVLFGGDMVEGTTVFPGQAYAIDSTLFTQIFNVVNIGTTQITFLLGLFDQVHVWVEKGNHGRYGRKGEAPAGDNFDLMAYEVIKMKFAHEKRVVWHDLQKPGIWNEVHIGEYKALLAHGDEIKGFGGNVPAFGILRKMTNWAMLTRGKFPFKDAYLGHFHSTQALILPDGGHVFMTGSPESDNDFATEFMGAGGDPSQRVHFIDPLRGRVTAEYVTYFED